jgi:CubicO group peptidase (beta-lactamase class C family)
MLLVAALGGCASPQLADTEAGNVDERLTTLARQHRVCAVALAVIKNHKLDAIASASGCAPQTPLHADSVFQAASLSKPVFAYAVLKLVAQGKMALDAPVMQYLPHGYRHHFDPLQTGPSELVSDARLQGITVRMALNHSSGLPNWSSGPLHAAAPPGTAWRYSGEGYVLLQRAAEAVTGQPLHAFMRAQVFEPLGMQHSDYVLSNRIAPSLIPGTKANGAPRTTATLQQPVAAFSLYTSASDYAKFLLAVLADKAMLAQIMAVPVSVDAALELDWGLGWGIARQNDERLIWQWGNNSGYRAFVIASPQSGNALVMLTNSENGLKLAQPLTQQVMPGAYKLFQFAMLDDDPLQLLCTTLRICL